ASLSRKAISRGVKSLKVRKCLLFRLKAMVQYPCRSESITYGWAAHAASAAAATAQFRARHLQHLDSGRFQRSIGVVIAVIADDYAGAKRQYVVAIIPLLALALCRRVPTGGHHDQRFIPEQIRNHIEHRARVLGEREMLAALARTNVVTHHLVGHFLEGGDHIAA